VAELPLSASPQATGNVEQIVRAAARRYGLDENYFVKIAMCESTMNPGAVNYGYSENGNPSGLFQHLSGYWPARAARYGFAGASVFDTTANAHVTAGMWADGLSYLWECK
jgi:soluble lytic murein transglycosylase-like protein